MSAVNRAQCPIAIHMCILTRQQAMISASTKEVRLLNSKSIFAFIIVPMSSKRVSSKDERSDAEMPRGPESGATHGFQERVKE
jgi:hypothetical protein